MNRIKFEQSENEKVEDKHNLVCILLVCRLRRIAQLPLIQGVTIKVRYRDFQYDPRGAHKHIT